MRGMAKRWTKKQNRVLLKYAAVAVVLVAAALAYYFRSGGTAAELRGNLTEGLTAGHDLLERGREEVRGFGNRLAEPLAGGGRQAEAGKIRVFFSPCSQGDPSCIDNKLIGFLEVAKTSIDCAFYELQHPKVAEVLVGKHRAGVSVRFVVDSNYKDREAVKSCLLAGIPVVFDERAPFMHNKFAVVDGSSVWTGSMNVTENGMYKNNNNALWIDSERLAADYAAEFEEMFSDRKFGARSPKNTPFPEVEVGGVRIECYFAPEDGVENEIVEEINGAQRSIDFMAFSFTSDEIGKAMAARINKGVRVRGLFEKSGAAATSSEYGFLSTQGAKLYLDENEYFMHNKVIIIDNATLITGSYNFSKAAERKNDENVLIIHSADIAAVYTTEFESLIPSLN